VGPETLGRIKEAAGPAELPKLDRAPTLVVALASALQTVRAKRVQQGAPDVARARLVSMATTARSLLLVCLGYGIAAWLVQMFRVVPPRDAPTSES